MTLMLSLPTVLTPLADRQRSLTASGITLGEASLRDGDEVAVVPAIAGGSV
jgi:hypothetical protein